MKHQIEQWLKSARNYTEGINLVKLIIGTGRPPVFISLPESSFTRTKLEAFLVGQTVNKEPEQIIAATPPDPPASNGRKYDTVDGSELPKTLKEKNEENKRLFAWIKHNHGRLIDFAPEERERVAFKMLDAYDTIKKNYEEIDHYLLTGTLKNPDFQEDQDPEQEMHKRYLQMIVNYANYPKYINKNKNNPAKAKEVAERQLELEYINEVIANGGLIRIQ